MECVFCGQPETVPGVYVDCCEAGVELFRNNPHPKVKKAAEHAAESQREQRLSDELLNEWVIEVFI